MNAKLFAIKASVFKKEKVSLTMRRFDLQA
jgi:hypothetical protein